MKYTRIILSLLTLISLPLYAVAMQPKEIVDAIVNGNRTRLLSDKASAELYAARASNNFEGPEIDFEHLWAKDGSTKWAFGISQNFEWPGDYSLRTKIAEQQYTTARLNIRATEIELRLQATQLLIHCAAVQQRIDFLKSTLADFRNIHNLLSEALQHGEATILELTKTEIEIAQLTIQIGYLEDTLNDYIADLNELAAEQLNLTDTDWSAFPMMSQLCDKEYYIEQIKNDPTLLALESERYAAALQLKQAKMSVLPGFGIGYRHEKEEGTHFNGFSVSLNLPTWNFNSSRKASLFNQQTAEIQTELTYRLYLARIESEYKSASTLRHNLSLLETDSLVDRYNAMLRDAFEGGELTIIDYLREKSYYTNVYLDKKDLEEKYLVLLASLNRYTAD